MLDAAYAFGGSIPYAGVRWAWYGDRADDPPARAAVSRCARQLEERGLLRRLSGGIELTKMGMTQAKLHQLERNHVLLARMNSALDHFQDGEDLNFMRLGGPYFDYVVALFMLLSVVAEEHPGTLDYMVSQSIHDSVERMFYAYKAWIAAGRKTDGRGPVCTKFCPPRFRSKTAP